VKQELQRQQLYQHREAASPESSVASPCSEAAFLVAESEPPPASSSSGSSGSARHRRVKSIGDIEAVSAATPV